MGPSGPERKEFEPPPRSRWKWSSWTPSTRPDSLQDPKAPDLRVVIADGARLYFTLAAAGSAARVYGGIDLQDVTPSHPGARVLEHDLKGRTASAKRSISSGIGGPEGSRFLRLELGVTELARALDLDGG